MNRFKYTLTRKGDTTYFSIQEQPEEWNGKGKIYKTSNGLNIASLPTCDTEILPALNLITLRPPKPIECRECTKHFHLRIVAALRELQEWADKEEQK